MLLPTRPHINNKTIKIGKTVPKGAVGLAYFHNQRSQDGNENVIVSEAPKSSIDHMTITDYMNKYCLAEKDEKLFPDSIYHLDNNGYDGDLQLEEVKWYDHIHNFEKDVVVKKEYDNLSEKVVPNSIEYSERHENGTLMQGTIGNVNVEWIPIATEVSKEEITEKKFVRKTFKTGTLNSIQSNLFQPTIPYNADGFTGNLTLVPNSSRFIPNFADAQVKYLSGSQSGSAASMLINGFWIPKLETVNSTEYYTAYGVCRYFGPYPKGPCGWNGGSFSDTYPRSPNGANYWTPNQMRETRLWGVSTFPKGVNWRVDYDAPKRYANTNTGWLWAESVNFNTLFENNTKTPQKVAEKVGTPQIKPVYAYGRTIYYNPLNHAYTNGNTVGWNGSAESLIHLYSYIWSGSGGQGNRLNSSLATWVRAIGATTFDQCYFRDLIGFYTGTFGGTTSKYGYNVITTGGITYQGEADYQGEVFKKSTTVTETANKWKAIVTYAGTIKGSFIDYNGIAKYKGTVTKKNSVGNINPINENIFTMYPDDNGYLFEDIYDDRTCEIQSELFEVTDMFKDEVPLFYSYRLKELIYDSVGPNEFGLCSYSPIKLLNSRNKELDNRFKYDVKLTKGPYPNTYYCDLYTSFKTNSNNHIYAIYTSYNTSNKIVINANTKEKIFVQPNMQKGTNFIVENVDIAERINKIKINNALVIDDTRFKVEFEYQLVIYKNHEQICVSHPIKSKAINYKYSLDNEKYKFVGRNYIVSPESKTSYQTAREIMATVTTEDLTDCIFYAKLTDNEINKEVKDIVNLSVNSDGNSYVTAEIFADTGFKNINGEYTLNYKTPGKYILFEDKIRCAYAVKCLDAREIKILHPRNKELLDNWYAGIQFGFFTQLFNFRGIKKKLVYSMPEFDNQNYSIYGRPYVYIENEKALFINENTIKIKYCPMYVRLNADKKPTNLTVKINNLNKEKVLTIESWSYEEGIICTKEIISENDNVLVSYHYQEDRYTYRGFYEKNNFVGLDLNTNVYHKYTNNNIVPYKTESSDNLFNKTIYYFVKPSLMVESYTEDGEIIYKYKDAEKFLTSDNFESFPDTTSVVDDTYSGEIPKVGDPYIESGTSGGVINKEFIKTLENANINAFPNNIEVAEDGYIGTITKDGEPIVISGENIDSVSMEFSKTLTGKKTDFTETVTINESGYSGNIPKIGDPVAISGELIDDEQREFITSSTRDFEPIFDDTMSINEDGFVGVIHKFGEPILISGIKTENEEKLVTRIIVYDTENEIPGSISFDEEGATGTLNKTVVENEIIGYEQIEGTITKDMIYYNDSDKYDTEASVPKTYNYTDEEGFTGILQIEYTSPITENEITKYVGAYTGTVSKEGLVDDLENPIRGEKFAATFEGTIKFSAIDTRLWEQYYKGILTKSGVDNRTWEQLYRGTLTKGGTDTRVWRQAYKGILSKDSIDSRLWKQRYFGQIKSVASKVSSIEIVFAVDTNTTMKRVYGEITKRITNIYTSLRDSSISEIKLGLVVFGDGKVTKKTFNGSLFSTDIETFASELSKIEYGSTKTSNTFEALTQITSDYNFTTNGKNIVLLSNYGTDDIELLYGVSNICNTKHINVHVVTDTYNYLCKMLTCISSETNGTVAEFVNDWDITLISGISKVCLLGSIRMSNKETIYHKIDNEIPNSKNDLYIGSIFVRHYTSLDSTRLLDSRVCGGGLLTNMKDSIRQELEIESEYYFDIGYWDGEPFNENGVIVIRLDKNILKENGGLFSENDVELAINKYLAKGIIPLIEYVSSENQSEIINEKMIIVQNNINNFDYKAEIEGSNSSI